jgi:DNA protecting protein DprA
MERDLQEQASWLLLVFESGLPARIINNLLLEWCQQRKRTLQEFFAADAAEWSEVCHLNDDAIKKLEAGKEKLVGQAFLAEQLAHNQVHLLTILDEDYPGLLKASLKPEQTPPLLFYAGDLRILERKAIAIIGSRNASEESLDFTRAAARYCAERGANVISGNARGVDRAAYEGATSSDGCTTVVLPHGIRKLSGVQMRALVPQIESGRVLLISQFHPDAQWVVSRAMERNKVVTGLAQIVIVAQSDVQGGTWEGANGALKQHRPLYVRRPSPGAALPGNQALIERGGHPLEWPAQNIAAELGPLVDESAALQREKQEQAPRPDQLSLFAGMNE